MKSIFVIGLLVSLFSFNAIALTAKPMKIWNLRKNPSFAPLWHADEGYPLAPTSESVADYLMTLDPSRNLEHPYECVAKSFDVDVVTTTGRQLFELSGCK